jgi:ABC-type dipeptide/oligopeptide/nickel transport system ATPase component
MTEVPATLCALRITAAYPGQPAVLKDIQLEVRVGETLGLVGESGSGKSTLALALMRLLFLKGGTVSGKIDFLGRDILLLSEPEIRAMRGNQIALVLQSPLSSLNPALKLGTQLREAWNVHAKSVGPTFDQMIPELMVSVSLPTDGALLKRYPRELSVGQAQRMLIAMAIMHRPSLLIADEPTSALDIITQREILELFARLSRERNMALLFISHDLPAVATLCERMAIIRNGEIVECANTKEIIASPQHEYTKQLLASVPKIDFSAGK